VRQTVNGRFIFQKNRPYEPTEAYETSWTHPTAGLEPYTGLAEFRPSPHEYEALSYAWGSEAKYSTIYIESRSIDSNQHQVVSCWTLQIRTSLESALRHLRSAEKSRTIWADNICINQDDDIERAQQVQRMSSIYSLASRVVVWIGPAKDDSQLAMNTISYLGQQVQLTDRGSWLVDTPNCSNPTWLRTSIALPYDDRLWKALVLLLKRRWFSRLWVWQESKLANQSAIIICGHDQMPLHEFGPALWCLAAKASTPPRQMELFFKGGDMTLPQFDDPFLNTLLHLQHKQCQDPRDKTYGALGLAPSSVANQVVPDYCRSVSDVYQDICLALC
jgi:hypothetical protein